MKTLSAAMKLARARLGTYPWNVVRFDWGGAIGNKWYSDIPSGDASGSSATNLAVRVVDWGAYTLPQAEGRTAAAVADITITLDDRDGVIRGYMRSVGHTRIPATVYQVFSPAGAADMIILLKGVSVAPFHWREMDGTIAIDITERAGQFNQVVGTVVTSEDWPYLGADQSAMLPIVFGRVDRRKAFLLEGTVETSLSAPLQQDGWDLYVNDSEDFPQNTTIKLWLDGEVIRGRFKDGNKFWTEYRGDNSYQGFATSTAQHLLEVRCTNLPPPISQYIGLPISIQRGFGAFAEIYERQIVGVDASISALYFDRVCSYYDPTGRIVDWYVVGGAPIHIDGEVREHQKGTRVILKRDAYTWVVNDQPSKSVVAVEASITNIARRNYWGPDDLLVSAAPISGYAAIPPTMRTINLSNGGLIAGRNLTTITMTVLPTMVGPEFEFTGDDLYVTLNGCYDAGGATVKSPPDVIRELGYRYLGMEVGDFDQASFEDVKDQLTWCHFGFMLQDQYQGLDLFADLAMQARCMVTWEEGKARLRYLREGPYGVCAATGGEQREAWSLEIHHESPEDVITEIVAKFTRKANKSAHHVVRSVGAMAIYGRRVLNLDLWAHNQIQTVRPVADFWLERLSHAHERGRAKTFLRLLEVERGDVLEVRWTPDFVTLHGEVMSVHHQLGNAPEDRMDNVTLEFRLPRWGGCESGCEMPCEVGTEMMYDKALAGCELACTYHCQSTCEEACEITCVSGYELSMVRNKEDWLEGCASACQANCTTTCVATCQVACETACASGCEVYCETTCESHCEVYCETGCETECESSCETACQAACQSECESGCELGCETGCETDCESGCETECELGCEVYCQTGCESSCEAGCETGCESGCEITCQTTCEAGCETSCETGCEVTCETGCEVSCETGCEAACESGCEVSCEVSCTAGGSECCYLPCFCWHDDLGDPYLEACTYNPLCAPWTTGNCTYSQYGGCEPGCIDYNDLLPWSYWYESNNCAV